jgi:hypothetical protein
MTLIATFLAAHLTAIIPWFVGIAGVLSDVFRHQQAKTATAKAAGTVAKAQASVALANAAAALAGYAHDCPPLPPSHAIEMTCSWLTQMTASIAGTPEIRREIISDEIAHHRELPKGDEMSALLNWFAAVRWRMSLSHCLEGLLIQIPLGLLFDFRIGALSVVVWYWSRKKLEMEFETLQPEESLAFASHAYTWAIGWFPWQWDVYKMLDVALPTVSSSLIALAALAYRGPLSPC